MPSAHPQAQFVPISPDFDLNALVENTHNFDWVTRLSTEQLKEHSIKSFEALVLAVVIQSGKPLVIEDWGASLPPWLFSRDWLEKNLGTKPEKVRDITNAVDIPMSIGHYLRSMNQLTNQFSATNYRDPKRQRLYLKDIDCPEEWSQHLMSQIPESVYYLNECIESRTGGDGAIREPNEYGQMRYGKGVAPAGDLMSSLPPDMRALNMMCYIGHEGTYTPAHREMCASLGQNIMVEASEDGNGEKAGSSVWFMTETKEREVVSEYFLSMLGHDIEVEKHFAQTNAWKKAPFNVWVVEQKVGDLILIPPLAPHQVWNRGTRTMKVAWNRTTVDTLELAMHEALPRARMVCRDEQYKNKAIIYYTLVRYYDLLQRDTIEPKMWKYGRIKQVLDDFKRLFSLYSEILVSEMFSPRLPEETNVEFLEYDSNVTCSYCRGNIFNRFLTCKSCIEYGPNGEEDTYDVCMDCYAMGRSCACISNLNWVEQWNWGKLLQNYETWRNIVVQADGFFDVQRSPQPIEVARKRFGKKPIAEVCQEQLKIRPWNDIKNPTAKEPSPGMSDVEPEVDNNGRPKNKKRGKFSKFGGRGRQLATKNKTQACHICCHHDWNWRLAFCTTCKSAYCFGTLWRAFDLMPHTVMEDKDWQCPKCLKMCSCGKCRKSDLQTPYAPKGTLLGHDTRLVADFRSVESLVDFSKTNHVWLRADGDHNPQESARMQKLKHKAEEAKARVETGNESYLDDDAQQYPFAAALTREENGHEHDNMDDIDPALRDSGAGSATLPQPNDHYDSNYAKMDAAMSGNDLNPTNGEIPGQQQPDWLMDSHYDLNAYDVYNHQGTNYPSRLLAPEAQMTAPIATTVAPEAPMVASASIESYPEPSHTVPNRMMGAGYYQQGNGLDKILYNALDTEDTPSQQNPSQNINMALSDLISPEPEAKKRKRTDGEGDLEFFTSKRQRELAKTKKSMATYLNVDENAVPLNETSERKPPRRAAVPKVYTDLGEEAVPIDEDDMVPNPWFTGPPTGKRKGPKPKPDAEIAAQTTRSNEKSHTPRNSLRVNPEELPNVSTPKVSPPRKSAWLARKEARETAGGDGQKRHRRANKSLDSSVAIDLSNNDLHSDQGAQISNDDDGDNFRASAPPKRGRGRPKKSTTPNAAIERSYDSSHSDMENEKDNFQASVRKRGRGRPRKPTISSTAIEPSRHSDRDNEDNFRASALPKRVRSRPKRVSTATNTVAQISSGESDDDEEGGADLDVHSLFGEQIEDGSSAQPTAEGEAFEESTKPIRWGQSSHPSVQIPQAYAPSNITPMAKKGRGRPPKSAPLTVRSPTPEVTMANSAPPKKMLSLKEKLVPSGKAVKIVASKVQSSIERTPMSVSHTPVTARPMIIRSPSAASSVEPVYNGKKLMGSESATSITGETAVKLSPAKPASGARMPSPQPVRKGPTVVRLLSSEPESEGYKSEENRANHNPQSHSEHSSDDSDSDASIPAVPTSLKVSRVGHMTASRGMSIGRGRGRGRGQGHGGS